MDLIRNPKKYFEKVRDRKVSIWLPLILILVTGIFSGIDITLSAENITLKDLFEGAFPLGEFIRLVLVAELTFYGLIAIQTFLFTLIIKKLGGTGGGYRYSFYILGMTTIPILLQSVMHFFFPGTVWWNGFSHMTALYYLSYTMLNVFSLWSIALLIIGFAKVYQVSYKKSSILYLQFLLKIIPLVIIKLLIK